MSRPLEQIELSSRDGVATITLDRPHRLNAFTQRMGAEMFGTIARLDADPQIRAIVCHRSRPSLLRGRRPRRGRSHLRFGLG